MARCGVQWTSSRLLCQYTYAYTQPVISGLPLQHAQGALLLSCELRCLNRWCLRWRCLRWYASAGGASAGGASAGVVSTGGFGLRFGAAGSVGTSCFGLFLLPGGLPRRFGTGASGAAIGSILFNYTWSRYNTNDKDDPRSRTTLPSRLISRKRICLRVTGPLRAMKCPLSEPVSKMVPTPLFSVILERMSSPRLPTQKFPYIIFYS